ncbi:hypothetical protein BpHYR1_007814 [Brachionus plicatilis]|uniref:Uncharacterized protein n=1 Tax=Brachionus plicatilis TaxID=10195 RepID=A0A3M7QI65_BRAPC|nr:hypothetical protein BpHYR1_007814 [Brachionus plicatilis]
MVNDIDKDVAISHFPRNFECFLALTKHANPVPCDLCGELMKNIMDRLCEQNVHILDFILMVTFFCEQLFTFSNRPKNKKNAKLLTFCILIF